MTRCSSVPARVSTKSTTSFLAPGWPTPMRRRQKASPCAAMRSRRPLCPPWPPASLSRTVPLGRSISSCATSISRRRDLVEPQHARHRAAAAVHEGHRLDQPDLLAADAHARELRLVFALVAKRAAVAARQLIHQPEAGVVARARVLGARIAEPDDELESVAGHVSSGLVTKNAARRCHRRAAAVNVSK